MSVKVVVRVSDPPVPVTVIVDTPTGVLALVVMVIVDVPEPGAAYEAGENEAVAPAGSPDAESATDELNPPETADVIVLVAGDPGATVADEGEALKLKFGVGVPPSVALPDHAIAKSWPVIPVTFVGTLVPRTSIVHVPVAGLWTKTFSTLLAVSADAPGLAVDQMPVNLLPR